jgi:hypothetical protein
VETPRPAAPSCPSLSTAGFGSVPLSHFGGEVFRYGWADSSTVAKGDWLICKHQIVSCPDSAETARASIELTRLSEQDIGLAALPEQTQQRRVLSGRLLNAVRIFTQPPMSLASGRTSLEHKVAALTYSYFLESGSLQGLRSFLNSFVSFTTDLGTEKGTASFLVSDVAELLPAWLRNPWLRADVDDDEVWCMV